jgi:cysteine-rich repeat protein
MRPTNEWTRLVIATVCIMGSTACDDSPAPIDSGSMDSGAIDAGPPDTGTPDTGAPDAGTPDAGAEDAGPPLDGGPDCGTAADGTSCGRLQICLGGVCAMTACGDGYVDTAAGEECEDGNTTPGDGCEPSTCQHTCNDSASCDDMNVCTGEEVCLSGFTCSNPADLNCDDSNPCTADSCDPVLGCQHSLIDGDGDGYAWAGLGACGGATLGGDCNDTDPSVHPDNYDGCDGAMVDNDCDGTADEDGAGHWYADCDSDGFASTGAQVQNVCTRPTSGPTACGSGGWTLLAPTGSALRDCNDTLGSVHPGATEVVGNNRDDDCDGDETCYRDRDGDGYRTDELVTSTDTDCRDAGEGEATDSLEWTASTARHICCDQNASVHAGQTAWFSFSDDTNGNEACPAGRRWDYDCNGGQTRRYTDTLSQCFWEPAGCSRGGDTDTSGWFTTGAAPGCGAPPLSWVSNCHRQGATSCGFDFSTREQDCH